MTNLHLKIKKLQGVSTLVISTILLLTITLLVLFAAGYSSMQQKTTANQNRNTQAFEAAEAGLEYGIVYLQQNSSTITANPSNGYINYNSNGTDANITSVSLANNSKYTIKYTNPIANNYDTILITSTGTSDDGTSTHAVQQQVQNKSFLTTLPTTPLTALGTVSVGSSAEVTNATNNGVAIQSGNNITIQKDQNVTGSTQANLSSLSNNTANSFFSSIFGTSQETIKSLAGTYCTDVNTCTSNGSSTSLSNAKGLVWINSAASINSSVASQIGTAQNPVILIVNGDFNINGNTKIYGVVFVSGNSSSGNGTPSINGTLYTTGTVSLSGNIEIAYDTSIETTTKKLGSYVKIPGSWRDF